MGKIILISGGVRSGKSNYAEKLLLNQDDVVYIAPAIAFDAEMKERIAAHKKKRNQKWITLEAYQNLSRRIKEYLPGSKYILLDCLTLLVSNLMVVDHDPDWEQISQEQLNAINLEIKNQIISLLEEFVCFKGQTIIVTNELGLGVVPTAPLGRYFRDTAGLINQIAANYADEVYFMICGIANKIKG